MEASPPHRASGTAVRRISGLPRSRRRPQGLGTQSSRASARRPSAAPSPAKSPCVTRSRRGQARRQAASGPCAIPGIAELRNLYSAWIEKLFDAPLDAAPSWPALHEVLRDQSRNFLFNHLGLGEDKMGLIIRPDCADLPYFLRAYFAFKMGLPFGYSKCTRGGGGQPPKCLTSGGTFSIPSRRRHLFRAPIQCGSRASPRRGSHRRWAHIGVGWRRATKIRNQGARDSLRRSATICARPSLTPSIQDPGGRSRATTTPDYYPVPLKADTLRPGTVYADPYGHLLVLARRVSQTDDAAGVFLAVDGQPDGTVARKRFWRGNFLFAQDPRSGAPGSSASGRSCPTKTASCSG